MRYLSLAKARWITVVEKIIRRLGINPVNDRALISNMPAAPPDGNRYLIVGLGNKGSKYQNNRHNIGFMVVDFLADQHHISLGKVQHKAVIGDGRIAGSQVILAKPQTMMNLSGDSVGPLAAYYKIETANILVIYDELDLPLGTIRMREMGGAGGHNGIRSIINHLGKDFPRLRLGIDRPPGRMPPAAFVLQDFNPDDWPLVKEIIQEAGTAVETFLREGIDLAMSRHNKSLLANT